MNTEEKDLTESQENAIWRLINSGGKLDYDHSLKGFGCDGDSSEDIIQTHTAKSLIEIGIVRVTGYRKLMHRHMITQIQLVSD